MYTNDLSFTVAAGSPAAGPLTGVTLMASLPAPQPVFSSITLTANPSGGSSVQYLFRACFSIFGLTQWTNLTGYTTSPTFVWRPMRAGSYTLVVWARNQGSTNAYDVSRSMAYTVR